MNVRTEGNSLITYSITSLNLSNDANIYPIDTKIDYADFFILFKN
jgi:hypothetical protein